MSEAEPPVYFFDTSALVKRYHQEKGTDAVDAAFDRANTRWISDLSIIEAYSAFARKVRTGEITEEDFRVATGAVAADIQRGLVRLVSLGEDEKEEAVLLIEAHGASRGLRTLDAMQLAMMKTLGVDVLTGVYCADRRFCSIIEEEGFAVIDPEEPSNAEHKNEE